MYKRFYKVFFASFLALVLASAGFGQGTQTGIISGTVMDSEGNPLPGVALTLTGTVLIGTKSYVSSVTGRFRFPALSPGPGYELKIEMSGFKTVIRKGLIVGVNKTSTVNITLEMTTLEEEIEVVAEAPVVDTKSAKLSVSYTAEFIASIPMQRDIWNIQQSVPGAIETQEEHRAASILGGTIRSQVYAIDGVNMNDPSVSYGATNLNVDIYQEVEMGLGAHQAEVGQTTSAYVNIVTKSGGNRFTGGASYYYQGESLAEDLISKEEAEAFDVLSPRKYSGYHDVSINIGGPVIKDKLWFFTSGRIVDWARVNPYAPEVRLQQVYDKWGEVHLGARLFYVPELELAHYDETHNENLAFLKLTFQITPSLKYMGLVNYFRAVEDPSGHLGGGVASYQTWGSDRTQGPQQSWATGQQINWILDQNTFFDIRGNYIHDYRVYLVRPELLYSHPQRDTELNVRWGRYSGRQEKYWGVKKIISASFTRFQDDFLGASHQFKLGVEWEAGKRDGDRARENPYYMYWRDVLDWNPYYYSTSKRQGYLYIGGHGEFGTQVNNDSAIRYSGYIQDSITAGSLSVNIGLRFDWSWQYQNPQHRLEITYPMGPLLMDPAIDPGDFLIAMQDNWRAYLLAQGRSDEAVGWEEFKTPYLKAVEFKTFSPRLGIVYDVFGDGKTAIKASFSRYFEPIWVAKYNAGQLFIGGGGGTWYWYDDNADKLMQLPPTDRYVPRSLRSHSITHEWYDPDMKAPRMDEFVGGVEQEVLTDLKLGLQFIRKWNRNLCESWDPLNGYDPEATDEKGLIWLPYTITDPGWDQEWGTDDDQPLTIWGLRSDRPLNSNNRRLSHNFYFFFKGCHFKGNIHCGCLIYADD